MRLEPSPISAPSDILRTNSSRSSAGGVVGEVEHPVERSLSGSDLAAEEVGAREAVAGPLDPVLIDRHPDLPCPDDEPRCICNARVSAMFRAAAIALLLAALISACGGQAGAGAGDELTVSAAASLTEAFGAYGESLPGKERFSFAGSDELAAQIRQGATPDVFASANTTFPEELAAEGLVAEPVVFAENELVIAVPRDSGIQRVSDLTAAEFDLVVGAEGVPVGDYTRDVIERLPARQADAILANIRSEESDAKGVIGKVAQGAADAGFVYASDAAAAASSVRSLQLPPSLEPQVEYAAAVVEGTNEPERAQAFIDGLLRGDGRAALADAGFQPPPR
jgi:molybdate transport system substrate-binding protein